mmetsp:Transcript_23651/g.60456  ORF Transcript_23651/g.60456 Transcript_23651/m.60456 type:complete len:260 (+) Transcript_23651:1227-2006(+)
MGLPRAAHTQPREDTLRALRVALPLLSARPPPLQTRARLHRSVLGALVGGGCRDALRHSPCHLLHHLRHAAALLQPGLRRTLLRSRVRQRDQRVAARRLLLWRDGRRLQAGVGHPDPRRQLRAAAALPALWYLLCVQEARQAVADRARARGGDEHADIRVHHPRPQAQRRHPREGDDSDHRLDIHGDGALLIYCLHLRLRLVHLRCRAGRRRAGDATNARIHVCQGAGAASVRDGATARRRRVPVHGLMGSFHCGLLLS